MWLVYGMFFTVMGITFVCAKYSYPCQLFEWAPPLAGAVAGHAQNVVAGILMVIIGAMYTYSYFKKR